MTSNYIWCKHFLCSFGDIVDLAVVMKLTTTVVICLVFGVVFLHSRMIWQQYRVFIPTFEWFCYQILRFNSFCTVIRDWCVQKFSFASKTSWITDCIYRGLNNFLIISKNISRFWQSWWRHEWNIPWNDFCLVAHHCIWQKWAWHIRS